MTRWIMFVGGGIETIPGVKLARQMGLKVLVSDRNPLAPCFPFADATVCADTYDARATLLAALSHIDQHGPLSGVICQASDIPWTVAVVAQALGLPGISLETAALGADKLAMKERLAREGVAIPWFAPVQDAAELQHMIDERGTDLVIKPVDSRGARGVIRLNEDIDPVWAMATARHQSPTERVMVEAYLNGPQLSTESLIVEGVCYTPGMSDRNYSLLGRYAPYFIEDGGDLPSHLNEETLAATRALIGQAARAMGIHNGALKGDVVVHEGVPHVIEVATRLSGGYFCSHTIPMNTGVDFVRHAIELALGDPVEVAQLEPARNQNVCQRYLFPEPGEVIAIEGVERARRLPGVTYLEMRVKVGDRIGPIDAHPARAGVLMTLGKDRQEAQTRAETAVETIQITTKQK